MAEVLRLPDANRPPVSNMNAHTLLLRQAHPKFMAGELPTSQVFMPNSEDKGKMSVYDGDQISPEDAYVHYTKVLKKQSHSIWALTKEETDRNNVPASPDPLSDFPSHAIIDFSHMNESAWRKVAKRLKALAIARACRFVPAQH
jgi:hypothetical protein